LRSVAFLLQPGIYQYCPNCWSDDLSHGLGELPTSRMVRDRL
jgi:hypothetical protein